MKNSNEGVEHKVSVTFRQDKMCVLVLMVNCSLTWNSFSPHDRIVLCVFKNINVATSFKTQ